MQEGRVDGFFPDGPPHFHHPAFPPHGPVLRSRKDQQETPETEGNLSPEVTLHGTHIGYVPRNPGVTTPGITP